MLLKLSGASGPHARMGGLDRKPWTWGAHHNPKGPAVIGLGLCRKMCWGLKGKYRSYGSSKQESHTLGSFNPLNNSRSLPRSFGSIFGSLGDPPSRVSFFIAGTIES